jgi:MFS family permease
MLHARRDILILFTTRIVRLFAYGGVALILALYLIEVGLREEEIGALFTLTLLGDAAISLWMTTSADRIGRRRMLLLGALLMVLAGLAFALTSNFTLLIIAAIIGVISPSGKEIGPFLSIEQSALSQLVSAERRTKTFAWYNLAGSFATAIGALIAGGVVQHLQTTGSTTRESYRIILIGYAFGGALLTALFLLLSSDVETTPIESARRSFGLHRSKNTVIKLSALFSIDAFAGGFIVESFLAYWFYATFGADERVLGMIFFGGNIVAGISALFAARIASLIGLINTMVFTHLPSNVLLCIVPFMPTLPLAIGILLLRYSISQMDVPTRHSYTMAVVAPDERSAASGLTSIARSLGASLSPTLAGYLLAHPLLMGAPFLVAGGVKIIYDLLLFRSFKKLKPPEETSVGAST